MTCNGRVVNIEKEDGKKKASVNILRDKGLWLTVFPIICSLIHYSLHNECHTIIIFQLKQQITSCYMTGEHLQFS